MNACWRPTGHTGSHLSRAAYNAATLARRRRFAATKGLMWRWIDPVTGLPVATPGMDVTLTEARLADVRWTAGYLSVYLADEDSHGPESRDWFKGLADHVVSLDPTDQRLLLAEKYLRPLFDDEALDGYAMYPESDAAAYLAKAGVATTTPTSLVSSLPSDATMSCIT